MSRFCCLALLSAVALFSACRTEPGRREVARVDGRPITVAELLQVLPTVPMPDRDDSTLKRRFLEELINREVLAGEAERRGLDEAISYYYEVGKKSYTTQEFYRHVTAPARDVSRAALDSAYRELATELHLRIIEVDAESTARELERELARGVPFESLAVHRSELPNAPAGGDLGWLPGVWLDGSVKEVVALLSPGEHTPAMPVLGRWQLLRLEGRREADPPPPPFEAIGGELTVRLRQFRQQQLAQQYQARLRKRLAYLPEGVAAAVKPVDSITPEELELPVAILDGEKYVKVARLMHVLKRLSPAFDTAMRRHTVEREIEEDLMYDEALELGLDRARSVQDSVADYRRRLLEQALYQQVVLDSVAVDEDEVRAWFEEHREDFGGADFAAAAGHIEGRLLRERREAARRALTERLRAQAKVRIDRRVLREIRQQPDGSWQ